MDRFSADRWEAARRRVVDRAFREVPFYREQWAAAGRVLAEPVPVASADLAAQQFRLCPLTRPWLPARMPSLWTGDPAALLAALRLAGVAARRLPVIEIRSAMVDWRSLGRLGPPYAAMLPPGADVVDEERRRLLNAPAATLAARAGRVLVVGTDVELAAAARELDGAEVVPVRRGTVAEVLDATREATASDPCLAHDPCLGPLGATAPGCGRLHLLWRRFHAREEDGALLVTALRRRPALCSVVPAGSAGVTVGRCPEHGTATLTRSAAPPR